MSQATAMSDKGTLSKRAWLIGVGAVAVAAAGIGGFALMASNDAPDELRGLGEGAEDVVLTSHRGERVRWGDLAGAPRAVFFGFTHCPVICPVTIYELTAAVERIGAREVSIQFVTVDPGRDTPERLAQYLAGFGPSVTGFTGEIAAIEALEGAFQVEATRTDLGGGNYTMDHTATVFLIDRGGRVADLVAYGSAPEVVDERLRALMST